MPNKFSTPVTADSADHRLCAAHPDSTTHAQLNTTNPTYTELDAVLMGLRWGQRTPLAGLAPVGAEAGFGAQKPKATLAPTWAWKHSSPTRPPRLLPARPLLPQPAAPPEAEPAGPPEGLSAEPPEGLSAEPSDGLSAEPPEGLSAEPLEGFPEASVSPSAHNAQMAASGGAQAGPAASVDPPAMGGLQPKLARWTRANMPAQEA